MAQHGSLREYDEGWERGDNDRERNWRDDDRERPWRSREEQGYYRDHGSRGWDRGADERQGNFILGGRDLGRGRPHDSAGQPEANARSAFRDDDRQYRTAHNADWDDRDRRSASDFGREHGQSSSEGDYFRSAWRQGEFQGIGGERSSRNFSSRQDDHYRKWRDRQMSALDRDYEDYCREREKQFHEDFDSWRQRRQNQRTESQRQISGSSQQQDRAGQGSSEAVMELNNPADLSTETQSGPNPSADATLGTNNSENSGVGRGRR
ncbi:MAG TPA: hypothetical protein VGU01_02015 [Sphingomicrobium sp.]|nr:hypothetical protein [Sphingomicrobium sp.]